MTPLPQPSCVLVTGADGFVGGWLVPALRERLGSQVRIVAAGRAQSGTMPGGDAEHVRFDITDAAHTAAVVEEVRPTRVVHLAGIASPVEARQHPGRAWAVNLNGTLNLARALLRHAPEALLVSIGTSEVYGASFRGTSAPLDETATLDPTSTYAASKAAAELAVGQLIHEGLRVVRLRPFNHTGPGQTDSFVVPAFAAQIARIERGVQEPILRVGNLEAQRDFLDVRDVVEAYLRATIDPNPACIGAVMNLSSGVPRRIGDILADLFSQARVPIQVESDPERQRPNDTPVACGDSGRAKHLLGWSPTTPWHVTLADVLDDWRSRPNL